MVDPEPVLEILDVRQEYTLNEASVHHRAQSTQTFTHHPYSYPKRHFNILSSPDLHLLIIAPNVIKIIFRDREQSSSECWCSVSTKKIHIHLHR